MTWKRVTHHLVTEACPVQVEGLLEDGRHYYFRYRFGRATFGVSNDKAGTAEDEYRRAPAIQYGDRLQGMFDSPEEMIHVMDLAMQAREEEEARL